MNPKMMQAMKAKKKRAVDPNAPPRPSLLGHEKVIKDTRSTIDRLQHETHALKQKVESLESRLISQTQYLNQLHQYVTSRLDRKQS